MAVVLTLLLTSLHPAQSQPSDYPAASLTPRSMPGWDSTANGIDLSAPADEPQGGMTEAGTPLNKRGEDCFPAEQRNLFSDVDMVPDASGKLHPFNYQTDGGAISPGARSAIKGKNTWILWGEGNDVFWNWIQQHGYGLTDFLVLTDSRNRNARFARFGLINQPGMKAQTDRSKRLFGLYIDQADGDAIKLKQPASDIDQKTKALAARPVSKAGCEAFEPWDREQFDKVLAQLPDDGLDPNVYGYPSGIVGLRLVPNPDFFGKTKAAQNARQYWKTRVEDPPGDAYYTDTSVNADPNLVRPFRVSMSCGFCHIAPHPLNPPADVEKPQWSNLSTTVGDQYWNPVSTFVNLKKPDSFLYQFLASQQPGTIDTSLVSTDHINNPNTITAIFDVPARLDRAQQNPPENQSATNLLIPHIEDPQPGANPRHTPRVLLDGSDSVGIFGALSRVYLNIGAYSEEWKRVQNSIVGFTPQRPFAVATALKNSVYWRTADKYRIPYLAAFFTYISQQDGASVTQPMHLVDTAEGRPIIDAERNDAVSGRNVFVQNCAVCHSSKQPNGFTLQFSRDWTRKDLPSFDSSRSLTLPMDFAEWQDFTKSDNYREYVKQIDALAGHPTGEQDDFLRNNFLSTDIRVPITLVGTNSARAVGTNAMRGQVWDNFSSETYKSLPAVGDVHFFNPFSGKPVDKWGNNDTYAPPAGGPGYYRPASLISLWATAPFLHNNTLGEYTGDPSIKGRLTAFDDAIDKVLWSAKRETSAFRLSGDLRGKMALADGDRGFIYRTTQPTWIDFPARFIRPLVSGIIGTFWTSFLTTYVWIALAIGAALLAIFGQPRHAGFVFAVVAILAAVVLRFSRIDTIYPLLWLLPIIATGIAALLWFATRRRWIGRIVFAALALISLLASQQANAFIDGRQGDLKVGPIPTGTPVSLIMNMNPEAATGDLLQAAFGLTRGILRIRKDQLPDGPAWEAFEAEAADPLMRVSKCPDFVLDRGHWFADTLPDDQKAELKAFLKTL
ncbi:hypothetical protein HGP17_27015 [Rhizobium sp. P38BS-XIX]|uniref:hypothetical protein n=1 Tax=Rhizobium sp. P38BS-XIX TaxID=2726740 RepID=UPI00145781DF|nr:hypothetical protein [Rhizobium sp. P38BS-XIX]NLS00496.1 hypothetical protein [Rhizobium sp. P38BS-XIX]